MSIITSPVSLEEVATILNTNTDLGSCCTSSNINIWAKYKPVITLNNNPIITDEATYSALSGTGYNSRKQGPCPWPNRTDFTRYGLSMCKYSGYLNDSIDDILKDSQINPVTPPSYKSYIYQKPVVNTNWMRLTDFVHSDSAQSTSKGYNTNNTPAFVLGSDGSVPLPIGGTQSISGLTQLNVYGNPTRFSEGNNTLVGLHNLIGEQPSFRYYVLVKPITSGGVINYSRIYWETEESSSYFRETEHPVYTDSENTDNNILAVPHINVPMTPEESGTEYECCLIVSDIGVPKDDQGNETNRISEIDISSIYPSYYTVYGSYFKYNIIRLRDFDVTIVQPDRIVRPDASHLLPIYNKRHDDWRDKLGMLRLYCFLTNNSSTKTYYAHCRFRIYDTDDINSSPTHEYGCSRKILPNTSFQPNIIGISYAKSGNYYDTYNNTLSDDIDAGNITETFVSSSSESNLYIQLIITINTNNQPIVTTGTTQDTFLINYNTFTVETANTTDNRRYLLKAASELEYEERGSNYDPYNNYDYKPDWL